MADKKQNFRVWKKSPMEILYKQMEIEKIGLLNTLVRVVIFGGITPKKLLSNSTSPPNELIFIIPGNPGLSRFYVKFGAYLHQKTELPVWIVSHGGHEQLPEPPEKIQRVLNTVRGQTMQKEELIKTYLKGVKLRCIGHSIGAKILTDLMKSSVNYQIESSYFLFPVIERLTKSPKGAKVYFIANYLVWAIQLAVSSFNSLPIKMKELFVTSYCYYSNYMPESGAGILEILDSRIIRNIFELTIDEMKVCGVRDNETYRNNLNKLRFYYGANDRYTPLEYFEDLKKEFPQVKAEVDTKGIEHSFVLQSSEQVGEVVVEWLKADRK